MRNVRQHQLTPRCGLSILNGPYEGQAIEPDSARRFGLASMHHPQEPPHMAPDDDESEDLYDDEFDFVDDEESDEVDVDDASDLEDVEVGTDESSLDAEVSPRAVESGSFDDEVDEPARDEEKVDEFGRPPPVANYVVHVYEYQSFKRTIDRPFTPEDAEAFASEYNRTSKAYGRFAVAGKADAKPRKQLD